MLGLANNRGRVRRIEKELGHQIISSQNLRHLQKDVVSRGSMAAVTAVIFGVAGQDQLWRWELIILER
jgi:hypothetical protein